jgi:hypothetical protein
MSFLRLGRPIPWSCLLVLTLPFSAGAQDVLLDEGTFDLMVGDREVGVESFTIRRVGAGEEAKIWATGTVEQDAGNSVLAMRPVLRTGAGRDPLEYQNKISGDGETEVSVVSADRRFVATIKSAAGERGRELRATRGAVFLEGTVVHQYYFLPPPPTEGTSLEVPVVIPRSGTQTTGTLITVGPETLRIAGRAIDAVRVRLTLQGEDRDIWRDREGRVLRMEIPDRGIVAERRAT